MGREHCIVNKMRITFVAIFCLQSLALSYGLSGDDCICFEVFNPVCGVDGKTYSNECKANCQGVGIANKGECQQKVPPKLPFQGCICPFNYQPVCGENGKSQGRCAPPPRTPPPPPPIADCPYPEIYGPVCNTDNNKECAGCKAGVVIACEEECPCQAQGRRDT